MGLDSAMVVYVMMELEEKLGSNCRTDESTISTVEPPPPTPPPPFSRTIYVKNARASCRLIRAIPSLTRMETFARLVTLLARRAKASPAGGPMFSYRAAGGGSGADLSRADDASHALAARIGEMPEPGDRASWVTPASGIIIAFSACLIARVIAVPID